MQLAPARHNLFPIDVPTDIVSPSRLFDYANAQFLSAVQSIEAPGEGIAANAPAVRVATSHALSGLRALESVLVPGTPASQRERAAGAAALVRSGVAALGRYESAVAPFGASVVERDSLPDVVLADLSTGYLQLLAAIDRIDAAG